MVAVQVGCFLASCPNPSFNSDAATPRRLTRMLEHTTKSMGYRRYRRKRSMAGEALADTAFIANRLSWKGAAIFGVVQFVIFYWLLPAWINHQLDSLQNNMFRPMVEAIFARRVHWVQWLGVALALVCTFFSVHNYFTSGRLGRYGECNVSFFSRVLARWLD